MSSQGWIKLHRELLDKPIWLLSSSEQRVVLITLLCMANHAEKQWQWQGKPYTCKPGQLITSVKSIKKRCGKGISTQNIRTALRRFKYMGFLTIESTKQNTLITICNWDIYQKDEKANSQTNQQSANNQLTTNNNVKNINNQENIKNLFRLRLGASPGRADCFSKGQVYGRSKNYRTPASSYRRQERGQYRSSELDSRCIDI
jgi:hypothetical protein